MTDVSSSYSALTASAGWLDLSDRTQIEVRGADRAAFLHNLCTNEIRKLPIGSGCEAMFLDARGRTLALALVFAGPESLVIETVAGVGERLLAHLERYHIREQVEFHDRSQEWGQILVAGAEAGPILARLIGSVPPSVYLAHSATTLAGHAVWLRRVAFTWPGGWLLAAGRDALPAVSAGLTEAGVQSCDAAALEIARVEAGWPVYGRDITDQNLPQEIARDATAISFVKGCYIGQETVARIDALGHVNRSLAAVRFLGETVPAAGCELSAGGQAVGAVTSAVWSPRLAAPLALAYVRRGSAEPGTRLESAAGMAEVVRSGV